MRIASLCTGYSGLELALGPGFEVAFVADISEGARRCVAHHHPGVINLGDITKAVWEDLPATDLWTAAVWADAPQVDIVVAGFPCQPFSAAGKQLGINDPRHIWPYCATAIRHLRPAHVLLENVPMLRKLGLGAVLADLAALGYVGSWCSVRACDVGAPHRRERIFIHAYLPDAPQLRHGSPGPEGFGGLPASLVGGGLLPTPRSTDATGAFKHGDGGLDLRTAVAQLMPTPTAIDGMRALAHYPEQHTTLPDAIAQLLPTPQGTEAGRQQPQWGAFAPAIARWEAVLGRAAPSPTEPGKNGPRLAPRFVEWMMGLPPGWVTDVPGLSRTQMLALLGNGVVPQQGRLALHTLGMIGDRK